MTEVEFRDWAHPLLLAAKNIQIASNKLALASIITPRQSEYEREAELLLTEAKVLLNDALSCLRGQPGRA